MTISGSINDSYSGVISSGSNGKIVKSGTGTQALCGANTYSGGTTVSGGTLVIGNTSALGSDGLTVSGGTLDLNGQYLIVPSLSGSSGYIGNNSTSSNGVLQVNGSSSYFGGVIEDAIDINGTKTTSLFVHSGTLTLTGENTYTGGTYIGASTLIINKDSALGKVPDNPQTNNISFWESTSTIQPSANLTLNVNRGIDIISNSPATFNIPPNYSMTVDGDISGNGSIVKTGSGTLTISGNNTYSGDTEMNGGMLSVTGFSNLGNGGANNGLSFSGGTLQVTGSGTITLNKTTTINSGGGTFDISGASTIVSNEGVISGPQGTIGGNLTKTGAGTLILGGNNIYSDTAINGGILSITNFHNLGFYGLSFNGGTLQITGSGAINKATTIYNGGGTFDISGSGISVSNSLTIGGTGALTKTGAGTLTLGGSSSNTYSGLTTVNAGTLVLAKSANAVAIAGSVLYITGDDTHSATVQYTGSSTNMIGDSVPITINRYGTLDLNGKTDTLGALNFNGGGAIPTGSGIIYLIGNVSYSTNANGVAASISGKITLHANSTFTIADDANLTSEMGVSAVIANDDSGSYGITKEGSGRLTFTSLNSYEGDTNIQNGTLELYDTGSLSYKSNIFLSANVTLLITGGTHGLGTIDGNGNGYVHVTNYYSNYGQLSVDSLDCSTYLVDSGCTLLINPLPGGPWPARIESVTSPNSDGSYTSGDTILVDVTFDESLTVTGTPQLRLDTGENEVYATYLSGSGTSTLRFEYTVQVGDITSDLDYWDTGALMLNGGTIQNSYQVDANLALYVPGQTNSLSANCNLSLETPAGTLDPSFGTNGKVATNLGGTETGKAMAIQADGKIIVAGAGANGDSYLVRYLPGGGIDNADFGTNGIVTIAEMTATAVALQTDGKILVAGYVDNGANSYDFCLLRYNADGSPDTNFGDGGRVLTDFASGSYDRAFGMVVQSDGKIVVAGGSDDDFALARYCVNDGTLDTNFGTAGKATTSFGEWSACGYALAIQTIDSAEKIIVAGYYNASFALARYNPDGALDTSFGSNGKVTTSLGDYPVYAVSCSIAIQQSDNKIVVAGYCGHIPSGSEDFAVARYTAGGALDTSFNQTGKVITDFGDSLDYGYAVVIQHIGSVDKIVVAGCTWNEESGYNFALARYNTDGSLDNSFGSEGILTTSFDGDACAYAMTIQSDGKLVVAGGANGDFALARYYI